MKTLDYLEQREAIAISRARNVPGTDLGYLYRRMATLYRRQIDSGLYVARSPDTPSPK